MRFEQDDYESDGRKNSLVMTTIATIIALFVLIFIMVLFLNKDVLEKKQKTKGTDISVSEEQIASSESESSESETSQTGSNSPELEGYVSGSTLTSDELDFWDMYDKENESTKPEAEVLQEEKKQAEEEKMPEDALVEEHKNQTRILGEDGAEEWVPINPYLTKNTYHLSNLVLKGSVMEYYEDSKKISRMGIDISKEQEEIDFVKLKKAGIEFVMIKVGARGYGGGQLIPDEKFKEHLEKAQSAGLSIGVYFFSQAVTEAEAVEEANMVIESLKDSIITYPVAFDMEEIKGDTSRIDTLSKEAKTKIAQAFLTTIKQAGYKTMIYGNKEWLIKKVNLSTLSEYDIWLSQEADVPDYPYKFNMWQYSFHGELDGVSGKVDLNLSFVDYDAK